MDVNEPRQIGQTAKVLDRAAREARPIPQLTEAWPLSIEDAYAVQAAAIGLRLEGGEKMVGIKLGFTSRAKMVQMGVQDLIWGRLTDQMLIADGGSIDLSAYVHPRVEPELAFLLKKTLAGTVTLAEAMSAVEAVAPAVEIIDSRYRNFKFSLADVIADDCSSAGFAVGAWHKPDFDYSNLGLVMEFNGRPVQIGSTAAILGHPGRSLVEAARLTAATGEPLQAGWIVMAGAATAAEELVFDLHVRCSIEALGSVSFSIKEKFNGKPSC